jgi:hypothetical protein
MELGATSVLELMAMLLRPGLISCRRCQEGNPSLNFIYPNHFGRLKNGGTHGNPNFNWQIGKMEDDQTVYPLVI